MDYQLNKHLFKRSSTIYNPFLYAWLNENFRKEFRLIIPWIFTSIKWCRKPDPKNDKTNDQENGDAEMCELTKYGNNQPNINSSAENEQEYLPVYKNGNKNKKGKNNDNNSHHNNNNNNLNREKSENNSNDKNNYFNNDNFNPNNINNENINKSNSQ